MDNQEMMVQGGYGQMQNPQPMNAGAVAAMSTTREAQEVQAAVFRVHSVTKKALKSLHFPTKYAIITARE